MREEKRRIIHEAKARRQALQRERAIMRDEQSKRRQQQESGNKSTLSLLYCLVCCLLYPAYIATRHTPYSYTLCRHRDRR
jgi:hypothetical protein